MRRATLQEDGVGAGLGLGARAAAPTHRLRASDVQVWEIRLDEQPDNVVAQLRGLLSADEEERAESFYFERDRRRFIVGRGVLRALLARYTGCAPADLAFRYGGNGKPELALPGEDGLHFNLAHSEGMALCALTRAGQIGVDVERIRDLPDWQYIASTCFSAPERRRVESAPAGERQREFFRAWTRQEAMLKASGVGLGGVPATTIAGAPPEGANPAFRSAASPRLRVYPLACDPGYAAAIAVTPAARWLTWHRWDAAPTRGHRRSERRSRRVRLEDAAQLNLHVL